MMFFGKMNLVNSLKVASNWKAGRVLGHIKPKDLIVWIKKLRPERKWLAMMLHRSLRARKGLLTIFSFVPPPTMTVLVLLPNAQAPLPLPLFSAGLLTSRPHLLRKYLILFECQGLVPSLSFSAFKQEQEEEEEEKTHLNAHHDKGRHCIKYSEMN